MPFAGDGYSTRNLSFDSLRGKAKEMARLLAACPMLDAHLAMVVMKEAGPAEEPVEDSFGLCDMAKVSSVSSTEGMWCHVHGLAEQGQYGCIIAA